MNDEARRMRLWAGLVVVGGLVLVLVLGLSRLAPAVGVSWAASRPLAGGLDSSFGRSGAVTHVPGPGVPGIGGITVQPDGRIVVASSASLVARYLPDGSLDQGFGLGGYVATGFPAYAVALQPDGRLVVAGASIDSGFAVARYEPDGSPDTSFGTDGLTTTTIPQGPFYCGGSARARARALALLPDGNILAAGSVEGSDCDVVGWSSFVLVRYTSDGALDPSFGNAGITTTGFSDWAPSPSSFGGMAVQPDGKIVATGSTGYAGHGGTWYESMALARYQPDGSLDPTFGTAGTVTTPEVKVNPTRFRLGGPALLQNGRILVAGTTCVLKNCDWVPVLARYDASGGLDSTFGQHGFAEIGRDIGAPSAMLAQGDRKILIAGNASYLGPAAVVRLLPDGRLDKSFGKGGAVTLGGLASILALQADGKILVGGRQGDAWTLTRLIGGNNCVVPALRGKSISKATATLERSYCRRGHVSRSFSGKVIRGLVISTTPPRGARVHGGAKIDLVVSRGKRS